MTLEEKTTRFLGSPTAVTRPEIQACFVTQLWQEIYAQVLIETDSAKQIALAVEAERQILARYVEHSISPCSSDETRDLTNALTALNQIRSAARRAAHPEQGTESSAAPISPVGAFKW
jgi:hypothetical protein